MSPVYFPSKRGGFWRRLNDRLLGKQRRFDKAWAATQPGDRIQVEAGTREPLRKLTGHYATSYLVAEAGVISGDVTYRVLDTGEVQTNPVRVLFDGENGVIIDLVKGEVIGSIGSAPSCPCRRCHVP